MTPLRWKSWSPRRALARLAPHERAVLATSMAHRAEMLINVRSACTRLGVLGSESQPDTAEIARTCEGLRRLLAEPTADEPEGIQ